MQCNYFGQDIITSALGLSTYIASTTNDTALLNYIGSILMLAGQQIVTVAAAQEFYCEKNKSTEVI